MFNRFSVATLNHLLAQQPRLAQTLACHAGKTARLLIPPHDILFDIDVDGMLQPGSGSADATLQLPLTLVPRLMLHDAAALNEIHVSGDSDLAAAVGKVLQQLRWDATEDLSRLIGDVAANRLQQAGQALFGNRAEWLRKLAENLAEHWTEEQPLIARREAVDTFTAAVDTLRDDVERLEKRLTRLENRPSPPAA